MREWVRDEWLCDAERPTADQVEPPCQNERDFGCIQILNAIASSVNSTYAMVRSWYAQNDQSSWMT